MRHDVVVIDSDDDAWEAEAEPAAAARRATQQHRKTAPGASAQRADAIYISDSSDEDEPAAPKPKKKRQREAAAAAAAGEEGSKPKRTKQKKQAPEKRVDEHGKTVRFSAQPSQQVYQRMQRALPGSAHRMFLISTKQLAPAGAPGGRAQEFVVLGATGNVYNVRISRHPHCDCPDHAKGHLCKHLLFVSLRVLKLDTHNPLMWQRALLTSEVEEVLSGAHSQGVDHLAAVLADGAVRSAYEAATGGAGGKNQGAAASSGGSQGRKPVEGDCPICFSELKEGEEPLLWCEASCGNNVHKGCFSRWAAAKRGNGQEVTCVFCRVPWQGEGGAAGAAAAPPGYLNLAQHSAQHAGADTSLEALYGESATWIHYHGGHGSRRDTASMWRSSSYGRR